MPMQIINGKPEHNQARRRFEAASSLRVDHETRWKDRYRQYMNYVEPLKAGDTRANISVPYSQTLLETLWPRFFRALLGSRPYYRALPLTPEAEEAAQKFTSLLDWQFGEQMEIESKAPLWIKTATIFGGPAPARVDWRIEGKYKNFWDWQNLDDYGMPRQVREAQIVYDDPEFTVLDPWDLWVAPQASLDVDKIPYVIHRRWLSRKEFKLEAELMGWKGEAVDEALRYPTQLTQPRYTRMLEIGLSDSSLEDPDEIFVLDEFWENDRRVITAGEHQEVWLDEAENPNWHGTKPFAFLPVLPMLNESYTPSVLDSIAGLQAELNALRNLRLDAVKLAVRPMMKAKRDGIITAKDLLWRPNGILWLDSLDDVEWAEGPKVDQTPWAEEGVIKLDMESATGAFQNMQGRLPDRTLPATTVVQAEAQANERFSVTGSIMEAIGFRRVARLVAELDRQFIMDSRTVGEFKDEESTEWTEVHPAELSGEFKYVLANTQTEPGMSKEALQEKWMTLFTATAQDPRIDSIEIFRALLGSYDVKNPDRFIREDGTGTVLDVAGAAGAVAGGLGVPGMGDLAAQGQAFQQNVQGGVA